MTSKSPKSLPLVSAPVAAQILGISRRQFDRLVALQVIPRGANARRFDLLTAGPAFYRYLRDGKSESSSITDARLKLLEAQHRALEQRTRERDGELIERAEVSRVFSSALAQIAAAFEGLPGRLASELATIDQPATIHEMIANEIRRIREAAAANLEQLAAVDWRTPAASAAEADGGTVG
jgi:hypothetical protein